VFKIVTDPFVGRLAYFRVYSGTLHASSSTYNPTKDRRERVGRPLQMYANRREEVDVVTAGDIAALGGLKFTFTGDTLCDAAQPIVLESIRFPEPVIYVAIEPRTAADEARMIESLKSLTDEDPTFRVGTDENSGQTIISGMGELHLEILVERLIESSRSRRRWGAHRWPTARRSRGQSRRRTSSRPSGALIHYTPVPDSGWLPCPKGGFQVHQWPGGKQGAASLYQESGGRAARGHGWWVLAGYPLVDVQVELLDATYEEDQNAEGALQSAVVLAFNKAAREAEPVLLEPYMRIEVVVPEDNLGDVIGDLNARRGEIEGWSRESALCRPSEGTFRSQRPLDTRPTCALAPRPRGIHTRVRLLRAGARRGVEAHSGVDGS